jgi:hypothetical protein
VSRRASTTCDFSMSFGPISSRSGTPRSSHSLNFQPGRLRSRSSSITRTPRAASSSRISCAFGSTVSFQLPRGIGTITTWYGRDARRQDQPAVVAVRHDDAADQPRGHAPRRRPHVLHDLSRAWNWMSNAFAKFCPRLCDVPACSARPSPISASIE